MVSAPARRMTLLLLPAVVAAVVQEIRVLSLSPSIIKIRMPPHNGTL